MNERQRRAIEAYGSNPSCDPLVEKKFKQEFHKYQEPKKKDSDKKMVAVKPS